MRSRPTTYIIDYEKEVFHRVMSVSVCVLCVYLNRDLHSTVVLNIESVSLPLESQNIETFFFF